MKKIIYIITTILVVLSLSNCNKEVISVTEEFPALDPLRPDTDAYHWLPILLTSASEFTVDAPAATSTPAFTTEINEIKSYQITMTSKQRDIMEYWSAGTVLRWNEIVRELVAKHNLPPYQNDDGSYPVPNSANPFAYPQFPFSNPPYAARAYAYVCAAQYDALIAASYNQNLYKRPSPAKVVPEVLLQVPESQITGYSYPSAEAAVTGATVEMLKLLFPTDIAFIQEKAQEAKLSRILAGASVRSDIDAGEELGVLVAAKFITRARGDKAGKAAGDAAFWAQLEQNTIAGGNTAWISMETPPRPPMLPRFGEVKGFLMDSAMVIAGRPAPPPSTSSPEFKAQVDEVYSYTKNPKREHLQLVYFWADGAGTYTPPGHWNAIAAQDFVTVRFSEYRWARNLALLNMAMMDAAICCWDTKYKFFVPRPSQMNADIKTLTGLPNFPSFTSGHSTFSGAAATFLSHVLPHQTGKYSSFASDASMSRLYGGIHYRMDCEVGLSMGQAIGNKAVDRAMIDGAE